jgi:hypothetical protein
MHAFKIFPVIAQEMAEKIGKMDCKFARMPRNKVLIHVLLWSFTSSENTIQRQDTIQHNENMTYISKEIVSYKLRYL